MCGGWGSGGHKQSKRTAPALWIRAQAATGGQANPRCGGSGAGKARVNPHGSRATTERSCKRGVWSKQSQATCQGITTNTPMKPALRKGEIFQPPGLSGSAKRLPSPLSTTSQGTSKQSGEAPSTALPQAPRSPELQLSSAVPLCNSSGPKPNLGYFGTLLT